MIHLCLDFVQTCAVLPSHLCADLIQEVRCSPYASLMVCHATVQVNQVLMRCRLEPGHPLDLALLARAPSLYV